MEQAIFYKRIIGDKYRKIINIGTFLVYLNANEWIIEFKEMPYASVYGSEYEKPRQMTIRFLRAATRDPLTNQAVFVEPPYPSAIEGLNV